MSGLLSPLTSPSATEDQCCRVVENALENSPFELKKTLNSLGLTSINSSQRSPFRRSSQIHPNAASRPRHGVVAPGTRSLPHVGRRGGVDDREDANTICAFATRTLPPGGAIVVQSKRLVLRAIPVVARRPDVFVTPNRTWSRRTCTPDWAGSHNLRETSLVR